MIMSMVFRADDEPVRSRFEYWRHLIRDGIAPLDVKIAKADFNSQVVTGDVGLVRVSELSITEDHEAFRTPELIRQSGPELAKFTVIRSGVMVVEQDGRQAALRPGDLAFADLTRPARWVAPAVRFITVLFPRALLPLRQEELARLTSVGFSGDRGVSAMISSLTRQLPKHLDGCSAADGVRLGSALLDLLTVGMAARLDRREQVPADTRQHALMLRIHAFIEQRLDDPGLAPATIAAAHHISLRYLYNLFREQDITVAGWIRERRLKRCRRDLADPQLTTRPISAIAARWGFSNPAHFSQAFRAAYGLSPREFREHHVATTNLSVHAD
jgi:AraC-like DNA-binding protein